MRHYSSKHPSHSINSTGCQGAQTVYHGGLFVIYVLTGTVFETVCVHRSHPVMMLRAWERVLLVYAHRLPTHLTYPFDGVAVLPRSAALLHTGIYKHDL